MDLIRLRAEGYVNLGVIDPQISTEDFVRTIGTSLKIESILLVQKLTPKLKESAPLNIYSGNFGTEEFPLHTDLAHWYVPPRYFLLRAIVPAPDVPTVILHHKHVLKGFSSSTIKRAMFQPRRKLDNKLFFLRPIQDNIFRWDELFLIPYNKEAQEFSDHIKNENYKRDIIEVSLKDPGECLLIDNWQVLHGRAGVKNCSMSRVLERIYLSEIFID